MDNYNKIIILRELQREFMRLTPGIVITFLSLLLISCDSNSQTASARTNKFIAAASAAPSPTPVCPIPTPIPLAYDTTSHESRNIISRLDNFYQAQARRGFNGGVLVG